LRVSLPAGQRIFFEQQQWGPIAHCDHLGKPDTDGPRRLDDTHVDDDKRHGATITPGVDSVQTSGSTTVSPTATTIYVLTANGSGGQTQAQVTVTALQSISLTASATNLTYGGTSQLTATGTYSDGSKQNLTASVNYANPSGCGSVNSAGLYTAPTETCNASITATYGTGSSVITSNAATITVTAPALALISITPPTLVLDAYAD
jgi:trimeric autotransporter adhesin